MPSRKAVLVNNCCLPGIVLSAIVYVFPKKNHMSDDRSLALTCPQSIARMVTHLAPVSRKAMTGAMHSTKLDMRLWM